MKKLFFIETRFLRSSYILMFCLVSILTISSCAVKEEKNAKQEYLRWVGDIKPNPKLDQDGFEICNSDSTIFQYFHFDSRIVYKGEKRAIDQFCFENYKAVNVKQSGLIRIRFVVNCEGKAGRFRMIEMNDAYETKNFDPQITNQLLQITKALDGWLGKSFEDQPADYYMYLIFKIKDGNLIEIMP